MYVCHRRAVLELKEDYSAAADLRAFASGHNQA